VVEEIRKFSEFILDQLAPEQRPMMVVNLLKIVRQVALLWLHVASIPTDEVLIECPA
jgi:hypothetical protein